jgi:hypothetical protein
MSICSYRNYSSRKDVRIILRAALQLVFLIFAYSSKSEIDSSSSMYVRFFVSILSNPYLIINVKLFKSYEPRAMLCM